MTEYLILEKTTEGFWVEAGSKVESSSAKSALRAVLNGENGSEGTFVAIPTRSWKPVKATKETHLILK